MNKNWTKKCTCENFQQNEDCEHIGDKVLEEVGMQVEDSMGSYHIANTHIEEVGLGVGDKDCPDCKVDVGCDKHYIQDGDRHDRLEGALTPLGYADINLVVKEITRLFLPETSEGSWNFTHRNDKVKEHISQTVNYKLEEIKKKIIEKSTFEPGVSSNGWYQIYKDDLDLIL